MAIYSKNGKYYNTLNGIENGEFVTYNPTHQMMLDWGYELYIPQKTERAGAIEQRHNLIQQINNIKQQLTETDYIALKAIEGYDCNKLYPKAYDSVYSEAIVIKNPDFTSEVTYSNFLADNP